MDLFGLNRFMGGSQSGRTPRTGPGRWLQAFWDNLGAMLGGNLLTFAGFLPYALGVSLGLVYENLWITLAAGGIGGALAGGMVQAGSFFAQLLGGAGSPPLPLWAVLCADLFLLSVVGMVFFPSLCARDGEKLTPRLLVDLLLAAPGRVCGGALAALLWCVLGAGLFPVSVPFALVLGFWPPALLSAQLLLPALEQVFGLPRWELEAPAPAADGLDARQRGEIWWRRRWPVVVIAGGAAGLLLWGGSLLFTAREPDVQIAVVHAQPLPDGVRAALERSLAGLVGDRNGDGAALAQVNDYTVVFDGSAANADLQTAGSTLLVTDLAMGDSALYLVEDPSGSWPGTPTGWTAPPRPAGRNAPPCPRWTPGAGPPWRIWRPTCPDSPCSARSPCCPPCRRIPGCWTHFWLT